MTSTMITVITTLYVIVDAWTVDLVCYHLQQGRSGPHHRPDQPDRDLEPVRAPGVSAATPRPLASAMT